MSVMGWGVWSEQAIHALQTPRSFSEHLLGPVSIGRGAWRRRADAWNAIDPCEIVLIEPRADRAPDYARHSPGSHA
ncbi:MAG: hypothetical protein QOH00_3756, partial [Gaiellales bacterium]|nr:hypothetical protein [Gaiellales bacterium]